MKKIILCAAAFVLLTACDNKAERKAEIETATQAAIDSMNAITERERLNDSMNMVTTTEPTISATPTADEKNVPARKKKTGSPAEPETPGKSTEEPAGEGTANTGTTATETDNTSVKTESPAAEPEAEPEEKKKKGINNTVKGAIIGAGAGAVGGAIINKKNPGKGAIIGGVVGAGAGAVTGVILDKNKKKKEAAKDSASKKTSTKEPDPTGKTDDKP